MTATQEPQARGAQGRGEEAAGPRTINLIQGVTEALAEELARDERVVLFG